MVEPVPAVTLFGVAAALALLGFFIRFLRRLYLVAGYDAGRTTDRATPANVAGGLLLFVGASTGVLAVITALGRPTASIWGAYALVVLVSTVAAGVAGVVGGPGRGSGDRTGGKGD